MVQVTYKQYVPPFPAERLEAIARILGDTQHGLTGSEIGHLLRQCKIDDGDPTSTKWKRLYNAFVGIQNETQIGNPIVVFLSRAMDPAKYVSQRQSFTWRREQLNAVLAFCGYCLGEDGKLRRASPATTLDEALSRASQLKHQLQQRNVHPDVLRFCDAELLRENYFHAVFEAVKSISSKIRSISGLTCDGAELVDSAFGLGKSGKSLVAINSLDSETLRGEQRGFMSLLKGIYGTIRNPLAHNAKIEWDMSEQDALDILTLVSLVHRKLDKASCS